MFRFLFYNVDIITVNVSVTELNIYVRLSMSEYCKLIPPFPPFLCRSQIVNRTLFVTSQSTTIVLLLPFLTV